MSTLLSPPSPAPAAALEAHFAPMTPERLDAVLAVEQSAYSHPWSRGNFRDSLAAGHQAQCLLAGDELLGYFVAMLGHREVHLLNITVAPVHQRQGWALVMLDALALWSRARQAEWLWLEVRASNTARSRCTRATALPASACAGLSRRPRPARRRRGHEPAPGARLMAPSPRIVP